MLALWLSCLVGLDVNPVALVLEVVLVLVGSYVNLVVCDYEHGSLVD